MKKLILLIFLTSSVNLFAQTPVGCWLFSGNTADSSGMGNHGTISGSVTLTTDRFNNPNSAYLFNTGRISIGSTSGFPTGNGERTMCAWFKRNMINSVDHQYILSIGSNTFQGCRSSIDVENQNNWVGNENLNATNFTTWQNDTNWHFLCAVFPQGGTVCGDYQVYFDGVLATPDTLINPETPLNTNTESPAIGCLGSFNGYFFYGKIDDVRLYSTALTASQILELYNAPPPTECLAGCWLFSGNTADSSGMGNHGTISGSATLTTDRFGNPNSAYLFNAGRISIGSTNGFPTGNGARTMCAWFKRNTINSGTFQYIFSIGDNGFNGCRSSIEVEYENNWVGVENRFGQSFTTWDNDTNWHFLCAVFPQGGTVCGDYQVYFDGVLAPDTSLSPNTPLNTNSESPAIGCLGTINGYFFHGKIDDVRLYCGALTASQIWELYNSPPPVATLGLTLFIQGFYNHISNSMVRDTLRVYLHNNFSPYSIVDSSKAYLDSLGTANFTFTNVSDGVDYYIRTKHRNALETWSKSPGQSFSSSYLSYNFTNDPAQALGSNMKQIDTNPLKFAIYSGDADANQDGVIDGSDASVIDNDAYNFVTGYVVSDITGDEVTDGSDAAIVDNNAYNFVTKATP